MTMLVQFVCTCVLLVMATCVVSNIVVYATTHNDIVAMEEATAFEADAILVLGASILPDGSPSSILQDRLDNAVELYFAGVAPAILVSGDHGTESYNEVNAMKDYVVSQGVPSEDVYCDHAGFSTYESAYNAKHVFGIERIVISTQTYHLYRALYAAEGLGMDALGVASDFHEYTSQNSFDARELLARTKDFFLVLFKTTPEVIAEPVSLDQSGNTTNRKRSE